VSHTAPRTAAAITSTPSSTTPAVETTTTSETTASSTIATPPPRPPFAVGERIVTLVDTSRVVRYPGRPPEPRTLVTLVRYPAVGPPRRTDARDARPERAAGPFPLIVFGHGFAVTPAPYAALLQAWARAGYVVAAPIFPLENANAPGGPDESDLVNEPTDISFVISRVLAAAAPGGPLAGLVDPARIALAGQSDGGEAALAAAYSRRWADPRVRAAVILSGAEMSGVGGYRFAPGSPALLAVQGTADTSNEPRYTYAYFRAARRPKYLLRLIGAQHLPPYTRQQPQLGLVERLSAAFLDEYLGLAPVAPQGLAALAAVPGVAALTAEP
jgi:dienelactone hydrolase